MIDKLVLSKRLSRTGLADIADAYREEVRKRLLQERKGEGRDRKAITLEAWEDMWTVIGPLCAQLESDKKQLKDLKVQRKEMEQQLTRRLREQKKEMKSQPPQPVGLTGLPDDLLGVYDPDYDETDSGKQLRDGLIWTAMQWSQVLRNTDAGPVVNLSNATEPPPNPFAITVLSTYALANRDKQRELIAKVLPFACKSHDEPPSDDTPIPDDGFPDDGFLDELERLQ